ncbi:MAG: TPM domain-containing protein [Bryobacteraceae bacterium]
MTRTLRCLTAFLLLVGAAAGLDLSQLKPQGYVSDFAGVIDPASRGQIESYATRLEAATGVQMAFVTLKSLEGDPIEDVAVRLFEQWGIGKKGKDEGLLLLLSIGDRRSRLEVGYGLEPVITDGTSGSILREMRPALRGENYGEAFMIAAQELGSRIASAKGVNIGEQPQRRRPRESPGRGIPWPVLIGGLVLLFWILGSGGGGRRGRGGGGGILPWLLLGGMMGGRGHYGGRSGGGGFGGYNSGGGFGGFGGGLSGGGGASGSW